jgi:hypothetical protein
METPRRLHRVNKGLIALIIFVAVASLLYSTVVASQGVSNTPKNEIKGVRDSFPTMDRAPTSTGNLSLQIIESRFLQVSGAYVVSTSQPSGQLPIQSTTNSSGYVFFPSLVAGNYTLIVSKDGYHNSTVSVLVNGNATNVYQILLAAFPCFITLRLLDNSTRNPISGVAVSLSGISARAPGSQLWMNFTDGQGFVSFGLIPHGNYVVNFSKSGYDPYGMNIYLDPGQNQSWIILLPQAPIQGGTGSTLTNSSIILPVAFLASVLLVALVVIVRRGGHAEGAPDSSPLPERDYTAQNEELSKRLGENAPPTVARTCPVCGEKLATNSSYCQNCGSRVGMSTEESSTSIEMRTPAISMGTCMVCGLEIAEGEQAVWCPYCRNSAHRTHMLEWLHVKNYCPICHHHLVEHDIQ